jgi:hypothetical protein
VSDVGRELRQVLAELELCSHVSAVNLDPSSRDSGEEVGGKRPPGGVDRREDRHRREPGEDRVLRSAQHFREQLAKGRSPRAVLRDAEASLAAYRLPPPASGEWPEYGTRYWKQWVARSPEGSAGEIARVYNVSRGYIKMVRRQWQDVA